MKETSDEDMDPLPGRHLRRRLRIQSPKLLELKLKLFVLQRKNRFDDAVLEKVMP